MNTKSSNIIKIFIPYILSVALAYVVGTVAFIMLPKNSVEFVKNDTLTLDYNVYGIKKALDGEILKVVEEQVTVKKVEYKLLSNIKLLAIYALENSKGWIIIEDITSKTYMLEQNDDFKGYKLTNIFSKYVVFSKNGQEYKLSLKSDDNKLNYDVVKTEDNTNNVQEKIEVKDDIVTVKRDYVNSYINDFNKIWKDIGIVENKKSSGQIDGFNIVYIKPNSAFEKLGLKKGDIIKEVNNIELKSYNDAFSIYKKINDIKHLHIKVLRNNQEVELDYEIK